MDIWIAKNRELNSCLFLGVPLISSWRLFEVEKKNSLNVQLFTAALWEKKMGDETDLWQQEQ